MKWEDAYLQAHNVKKPTARELADMDRQARLEALAPRMAEAIREIYTLIGEALIDGTCINGEIQEWHRGMFKTIAELDKEEGK